MSIEVVFGEETQEILEEAQWAGIGPCPKEMLKQYKEDDNRIRREKIDAANKRIIEKWNTFKPLGGRPEDIICLDFNFEYGDISEAIPSDKRYESLITYRFAEGRVFDKSYSDSWIEELRERNDKYLSKLTESMNSFEKIRIWYSDEANNSNAFHWLMNYFETNDYYQNIVAVKMPLPFWGTHWAVGGLDYLEPGQWYKLLPFERVINEEEVRWYSKKWERLKSENAPLRLVLNGDLISFTETVIDECIFEYIKTYGKQFKLVSLLDDMGKLGVSENLIFARIIKYIEDGKIKLVNNWNYSDPGNSLLRLGRI